MSRIWQRDERVLWRGSGHHRLLSCAGRSEIQHLDGVGAFIWDQLVRPRTETELVMALVSAYGDAQMDVLERDTLEFLRQLEHVGATTWQ